MTERHESLELEALLWAWTNVMGRLPDQNTMTGDEIEQYWEDYANIVRRAIVKLTGLEPDDYSMCRAYGESSPKQEGVDGR